MPWALSLMSMSVTWAALKFTDAWVPHGQIESPFDGGVWISEVSKVPPGDSNMLPRRITKPKSPIPSLWDLMPDDLSWSCYSNNRSKVHNKCNIESS